MEELEQDIIEGALGMFFKYGIRSVTMDDVARELSISKKTIYKFFENKADLVHKCAMVIHERIYKQMLEVHNNASNPIDELFDIDNIVCEVMENHSPSMQFQLQKYYPKTYNYVYEGRHNLIHRMISENIEHGKKDGLFRSDVNTEIVTFLYCSKVETMPEEEEKMMSRHPMKVITRQALEYHIRGIATEKGIKYLEQKLKTINNDQEQA